MCLMRSAISFAVSLGSHLKTKSLKKKTCSLIEQHHCKQTRGDFSHGENQKAKYPRSKPGNELQKNKQRQNICLNNSPLMD